MTKTNKEEIPVIESLGWFNGEIVVQRCLDNKHYLLNEDVIWPGGRAGFDINCNYSYGDDNHLIKDYKQIIESLGWLISYNVSNKHDGIKLIEATAMVAKSNSEVLRISVSGTILEEIFSVLSKAVQAIDFLKNNFKDTI